MDNNVSEVINEEVQSYTETSYDYLDAVKILVFAYLLKKVATKLFKIDLDKLTEKYDAMLSRKQKAGLEKVANNVINEKPISKEIIDFSKKELNDLMFKPDKTSQKAARDRFIRILYNYYNSTLETLKKEYIDDENYLAKKLSEYDKVEKVIAYRRKDGTIRAYYDIASYNSMVYNTNLTSSAWNETMRYCQENSTDVVYVEPHPYSCPLCQEWQGKFYSLTGKTAGLTKIETAIENGLKHPNCKHNITTNVGQHETDKYSSEEWKAKYEARQKKQALELRRKRLNVDKKIFESLGDQQSVDGIKKKISKLSQAIKEQKKLME